jgi:uncharacterized repeat protein (TIGR03803 family)
MAKENSMLSFISLRRTAAASLLFFAACTSSAFSQTFTVLHTFHLTDGELPFSGLIHGSDGNLYGTTAGGEHRAVGGEVFKITTSGKFSIMHAFSGSNDGAFPQASVIRDSGGNLYGTTTYGGSFNAGVVYKVTSARVENVIYTFTGGTDGGGPTSDLVRDAKGNLYGTTVAGGNPACTAVEGGLTGCGTVFKIDTTGTETVLYTFAGGSDGAYPFAGVVMDSSGNLYGTTSTGGLYGAGQIFKIDTSNNKTDVHDFEPGVGNDGADPKTDLTFAAGGVLYGTTLQGGDLNAGDCARMGCGAAFELDTNDVVTTIHSFEGPLSDGQSPSGPLARDTAGNFYGTSYSGGIYNAGAVYKMTPSGTLTILHSFTGGSDGLEPNGRVYVDSAGVVYGNALSFQPGPDYGVIFKITP